MKRFFTLALGIVTIAAIANAWTPRPSLRLYPSPQGVSFNTQFHPTNGVKTVTNSHGITTLAPDQSDSPKQTQAKALSNASEAFETDHLEDVFEVKCKMVYENEDFFPTGYLTVYNEEIRFYEDWDWESDFINVYLAPGTYDFLMPFTGLNNEAIYGETGEYLVILEQIKVDKDMTLEFNPAEANKILQFNPTLKNGEQLDMYTIKYIDDEWNIEVVNNGNCQGLAVEKELRVEGCGMVYQQSTGIYANIEKGRPGYNDLFKADWVQNWYITPVSNRYQFINSYLIDPQNKTFEFVILSSLGSNSDRITNDASLFYPYIKAEFESSPLNNEKPDNVDYPYILGASLFSEDGPGYGFTVNSSDDRTYTVAFCPPNEPLEGLYPKLQFRHIDAREMIHHVEEAFGQTWEWYENLDYITETPWINMINGQYFDNMGDINELLAREENGDPVLNVGNEALGFNIFNSELKFGGSALWAYIVISDLYWEGEEAPVTVNLQLRGQMGEIKQLPNIYDLSKIESINNNPRHFTLSLLYKDVSVNGNAGTIEVSGEYDLNTNWMPILTGMQCRTVDGIVNDTFDNGKEGHLLLTLGAFETELFGYNDWGYPIWGTRYHEADVKVEYAAHGTDNFETLEAEPLTTEPQLPGIGQLYTYNLGQVDQTSADGWFDARITITAPGGNVQTQTIAPLFCIKSTTGISTLDTNTSSQAEYFNLQGIRVENPTSGLYLVKRGNTVTKQFIR